MTASDYTATLPRKRMGAGALLSDQFGRVLLVEPTYAPHWELPGGAVEANESPHAATMRELREELGVLVRVGRLLVTDWVPPRPDRTEGIMMIYDGGLVTPDRTARIRLPVAELRQWAWCTQQDVVTLLPEILARRVIAAIRARADGASYYLENGYFVA
ncbi:NUDIX domain-containing protein [Actinoplanes sp. NPDC020271]|uniref:NUDIX domain-containing protein n=1 Tax=Actinoplanes sp. NPDC020271 TaxID=3363896 RepID=UPI0037B374F9